MIIIRFLIFAVVIFTGFRILNLIIKKLTVIPMRIRNQLANVIPVFELVVWIVALLWIARYIYETKNYLALLFIVILFSLFAIPLFFVTRNLIAGIILRLQNRITEGMYIEVEGTKGIVKKAGHLGLEIEDRQSNFYSVPYHTIHSKRIIRQGGNPYLEKVTIRFEFPQPDGDDELYNKLIRAAINTPWVAVSFPPVIENTFKENGKTIIDLGVFLPDRMYADNIKSVVCSALSE